MKSNKLLLILSAVCFSIGAIVGVAGVALAVNWLCAGFAFWKWAEFVGS